MTEYRAGVPDPRIAGKPRSLHPGGQPLSAADGGAGDRRSAARWKAADDIDAARQLVLSHLRLVVAVSRNYLGYGLPQADLIQEGNVGLMKAVRRFDPERGVRLVSFALHWIRAEMHEYILRNWRLVKVATTKAQRKLFFNLRSMKARSARADATPKRRPSPGTWASSRRKSSRWRRALAATTWRSIPTPGDDDNVVSPIAWLTDSEDEPAQILEREQTSANRSEGLQARAGQARRPQPPHHRSALAARGRLRPRCRSSPTSTACRPSGSARSRARR